MADTPREEQIFKTLLPFLKIARVDSSGDEIRVSLPPFSLENVVGKTIASTRMLLNPLSFNAKGDLPNPNKFRMLIFGDGSYILFDEVKYQERTTLHSFLVENDKIRYSNNLFREFKA